MELTTRFAGGLAAFIIMMGAGTALADSAHVAVAANFTATAEELATAFKAESGHDLVLSFGATGTLYTQITQGAPFEVFLSADARRPKQAVDEGLGVPDSIFTYAIGTLVVYSTTIDLSAGLEVLKSGAFEKLAIADPETAPYGAAAVEVLKGLGLYEIVEPKLVTGENISQTLQFIASGNAELGFVALSQVADAAPHRVFAVPTELHAPITQDAVLLRTGEANVAAQAFIAFLKGDVARKIISKAGYAVAD